MILDSRYATVDIVVNNYTYNCSKLHCTCSKTSKKRVKRVNMPVFEDKCLNKAGRYA